VAASALAPADAGEKQEAYIPADAEEKQVDLDLLKSRQVGEAAVEVEVEDMEVALDAFGNPGLRGIEVALSSHPGARICTRRRVDTSRDSRALRPYVVGL
jgi:hypothetical protein